MRQIPDSDQIPLKGVAVLVLFGMWILVVWYSYEAERSIRVEFLWTNKAYKEQQEAHELKEGNRRLIYNILPVHVVKSYVLQPKKKYRELYYAKHRSVGVMFARVSNFEDFFIKEQQAGRGLDCLTCLNFIITEFDRILDIDPFNHIEKIKTIGATYMCAVGLASKSRESRDHSSRLNRAQRSPQRMSSWDVVLLGDLYFEMSTLLKKNTACEFKLRGGISVGSVIAGVIGAQKPHFDIWGDTVNEASRMECNSQPDSCLVTQLVATQVQDYFDLDGPHVKDIKGKGLMETFFLRHRRPKLETWPLL